jgi:hypothetical protein
MTIDLIGRPATTSDYGTHLMLANPMLLEKPRVASSLKLSPDIMVGIFHK